MVTTIQIDEELKQRLDKIKIHKRESYNELLFRILDNCAFGDAEKESLIATLEVMSDPETMRNIADALSEIEKGNFGKSLDEIEKERGF